MYVFIAVLTVLWSEVIPCMDVLVFLYQRLMCSLCVDEGVASPCDSTHFLSSPGHGGDGQLRRSAAVPFRENFARVCFEALLRFSFINSQETTIGQQRPGLATISDVNSGIVRPVT